MEEFKEIDPPKEIKIQIPNLPLRSVIIDNKVEREPISNIKLLNQVLNSFISYFNSKDSRIIEALHMIIQNIIQNPGSTIDYLKQNNFFELCNRAFSIYYDDFDVMHSFFSAYNDIIDCDPQLSELFGITLFENAVNLADCEYDSLIESALWSINNLLEHKTIEDYSSFYPTVIDKLAIAWTVSDLAADKAAKILHHIIEQEENIDLYQPSLEILDEMIQNEFTPIEIVSLLIETFNIIFEKYSFDDFQIEVDICESILGYINEDISTITTYSPDLQLALLNFLNILTGVVPEEIVAENEWLINFNFIKFSLMSSSESFAIATEVLTNSMTRYMFPYLDENELWRHIFDFVAQGSYKVKLNILKLINAFFKEHTNIEVYEIILMKNVISIISTIISQCDNSEVKLLYFETITLIFRASQLFGDDKSVPLTLDNCGAIEEIVKIADEDDDMEVAQAAVSLLEMLDLLDTEP